MKKMNRTNLKVTGLLALIISVGTATSGHAQLIEQLQAKNYNAGVWTATVGSDASTSGGDTSPSLVTNATPNGSSAVGFNGSNTVLTLATALPAEGSYTAFVYALPTATGDGTFFGGGGGSFQYRVTSDYQDVVQQGQADPGHAATLVSSSAFSLFDVTVSSSAVTFNLNGSSDGQVGGVNITNTIQFIGNNDPSGGEAFTGDIAEIDIFSGVLTPQEIATEEAAITAEYATTAAAPEPSTWALLLGGLGSLVVLGRFRKFGQA